MGGGSRGGEWAWCRFAFLLMHTARPPALSSFYSLPTSPAPCNGCSLYAVSVLIPNVHASLGPPRAVLLGMCF